MSLRYPSPLQLPITGIPATPNGMSFITEELTSATLVALLAKKDPTGLFHDYSYSNSRNSEENSIISDDESIGESLEDLQQIKTLIPSLFKTKNIQEILSQYFLNELFFAESLYNLHENFELLQSGVHPSKLQEIDAELAKLSSVIENFNSRMDLLCSKYNSIDISLNTLREVKEELHLVIHKYLGQDLNEVVERIDDMIFEYNMVAQSTVKSGLYEKVTSTLNLQSDRININKVSHFKNLLMKTFIDNKRHREYILELLRIVNA